MNGSAPNVHRWSASYPAGVAQTVNTSALVSLKELVEEAFRSEGAKVRANSDGSPFTFAELDRYSLQFAAWLQSEGVRKGDRVAIMLRTCCSMGWSCARRFRVGAVRGQYQSAVHGPGKCSCSLRIPGRRLFGWP